MYFSASISVTLVRLLLAYVGDRGCRIQSHKREAGGGSPRPLDETIWAADETFLAGGAVSRKRLPGTIAIDQTGGSIMWAIISSIYRAYCYARLLEMRSNHRHASHA